MAFVTSPFAAMQYLCKYVTKGEAGNMETILRFAVSHHLADNLDIAESQTERAKHGQCFC